jgi:hypothetical protein
MMIGIGNISTPEGKALLQMGGAWQRQGFAQLGGNSYKKGEKMFIFSGLPPCIFKKVMLLF